MKKSIGSVSVTPSRRPCREPPARRSRAPCGRTPRRPRPVDPDQVALERLPVLARVAVADPLRAAEHGLGADLRERRPGVAERGVGHDVAAAGQVQLVADRVLAAGRRHGHVEMYGPRPRGTRSAAPSARAAGARSRRQRTRSTGRTWHPPSTRRTSRRRRARRARRPAHAAARRATTSAAAPRRTRRRGPRSRAHARPARRRMPRPFWVAPSSPSRTSVYDVPYETGTAGASSRTISSARA